MRSAGAFGQGAGSEIPTYICRWRCCGAGADWFCRREEAQAETTRDILIQTDRPDEASVFYSEVLGFQLVQDDPSMRGFETGAFRLFIDPGTPLGPILEVLVDDVEAEKTRLLNLGCRIEREDASVPCCYIRDAFGLTYNLRTR